MKKIQIVSTITLVCLCCFIPNISFGVPADPALYILTQSDGSTFLARQWGDEESHGWETVDGYTIVFDEERETWTYAVHGVDGGLVSSLRMVGTDSPPVDLARYLRPTGQAHMLIPLMRHTRELSD